MSAATVRAELAAAANTIEGLQVSPTYRQSHNSGDGVVMMQRANFPNQFGGIAYWVIQVLLPVDLKKAQELGDDLVMSLPAALSEVLTVTDVTFAQALIDNSPARPCIEVVGYRSLED
jgi:hypothetical protein